MSLKRCLGLAIVLAMLGSSAEASTIALSFTSESGGFADGAPRMLGWQFTVNNDPIVVTALGFHDFGQDGLNFAHQVGIWLPDQTLVASVTVQAGTASPLTNFFRFESLASPVTLSANTSYIIAGFDQGSDRHVWDAFLPGYGGNEVSGFAASSAITLGPAASAFGPYAPAFQFPTNPIGGGDTRRALMGPNLLFGSADAVAMPEPATLVLLGTALVFARRRRHDGRK